MVDYNAPQNSSTEVGAKFGVEQFMCLYGNNFLDYSLFLTTSHHFSLIKIQEIYPVFMKITPYTSRCFSLLLIASHYSKVFVISACLYENNLLHFPWLLTTSHCFSLINFFWENQHVYIKIFSYTSHYFSTLLTNQICWKIHMFIWI